MYNSMDTHAYTHAHAHAHAHMHTHTNTQTYTQTHILKKHDASMMLPSIFLMCIFSSFHAYDAIFEYNVFQDTKTIGTKLSGTNIISFVMIKNLNQKKHVVFMKPASSGFIKAI